MLRHKGEVGDVFIRQRADPQVGIRQVDALFRAELAAFDAGAGDADAHLIGGPALDEPADFPVVKKDPFAGLHAIEDGVERARDPRGLEDIALVVALGMASALTVAHQDEIIAFRERNREADLRQIADAAFGDRFSASVEQADAGPRLEVAGLAGFGEGRVLGAGKDFELAGFVAGIIERE